LRIKRAVPSLSYCEKERKREREKENRERKREREIIRNETP
jgi:hypothetical protein